MSSSDYELNLDGSYQGLPVREEKRFRARSPFTWNLVKDDHGVAPESLYANKELPALSIDSNTDDGVVIPQGVIVALHNVWHKNVITAASGDTELGVNASGCFVAGANAYGTDLSYSLSDSKNGYGDYSTAVYTIANGGTEVQDIYTTLDEYLERVSASTGTAIAADDTYTRAANIPFGVSRTQMFLDYRGKYLNSDGTQLELNPALIDTYIEVPYIIDDATNSYKFATLTESGGVKSNVAAGTKANHAGYNSVLPYCGFLYTGGRTGVADAAIVSAFANGEYLVSDFNGRFIPQNATTANALTQTKTAQTVGRLISLDNKWPKALDELVDTYEGLNVSGTSNAGIPKFLYAFVEAVLKAAGKAYTRSDILSEIQKGRFGMATIEILPA